MEKNGVRIEGRQNQSRKFIKERFLEQKVREHYFDQEKK